MKNMVNGQRGPEARSSIVSRGKAAKSMPLSTLLGVNEDGGPGNDGAAEGGVHEVRAWPRYKVGPNLGCRAARGKMELGEQHSGVKDGIPYTIRRVR